MGIKYAKIDTRKMISALELLWSQIFKIIYTAEVCFSCFVSLWVKRCLKLLPSRWLFGYQCVETAAAHLTSFGFAKKPGEERNKVLMSSRDGLSLCLMTLTLAVVRLELLLRFYFFKHNKNQVKREIKC